MAEETLDVEAVHAVAPDASITYVGAASCFDNDLLDSLNKVVDNHLADIVSNSWGDIEANQTPDLAAAYDQTFQFGAVEGIGFYFSSGDNGDEVANTGTKQVDTPANSAWVTAVGGTSLAVGKGDKYQFETGWGTEKAALAADGKSWTGFPGAFTSGAGGGTSKTVAQPFYQKGVVPGALAKANGTTAMRTVPDIAAVADPNTGFKVGQYADLPGRVPAVQRVPDRRHLARRAGDRGRPGPGPGGTRRQGDRFRQPVDLREVRLQGVPRRDISPAPNSPWRAWTSPNSFDASAACSPPSAASARTAP